MTQTGRHSPEDPSARSLTPRLQIAVNKIIENSIPFNLEAIQRHKQRIEELRLNKEWHQLLKEQNNGLQTVQRLKADLRALEYLAEQVDPTDRQLLCQKVLPIQKEVCRVVHQFIDSNPDLETNPLLGLDFGITSNSYENNDNSCSDKQMDANLQLNVEVIESRGRLKSWQILTKELHDLNHIFNTLMATLMGQKDQMNSIEGNIGSAHEDLVLGNKHLARASALKSAFVPITTGLISGAVFGPIGMVAGFKFAGIAAGVGASVLGYMGGRAIQNKSISAEEIEMVRNEEESLKRSKSQ